MQNLEQIKLHVKEHLKNLVKRIKEQIDAFINNITLLKSQ